MNQQPPSGNLQWFKPQPNADGKFAFPENVVYLAATWCSGINRWSFGVGVWQKDHFDESWELLENGGAVTFLEEIDWLARLDIGRPDPQRTMFIEPEGGE